MHDFAAQAIFMLNFAFRYAILNMYAADCGFIRKNGDPMTKITKSADETEALGAYIASLLDKKTSFVALYGEMGAGKTAFVRGFASGHLTRKPREKPDLYRGERVQARGDSAFPLRPLPPFLSRGA